MRYTQSICLSLSPVLTINLKAENHTTFILWREDITHVSSNWQSTFVGVATSCHATIVIISSDWLTISTHFLLDDFLVSFIVQIISPPLMNGSFHEIINLQLWLWFWSFVAFKVWVQAVIHGVLCVDWCRFCVFWLMMYVYCFTGEKSIVTDNYSNGSSWIPGAGRWTADDWFCCQTVYYSSGHSEF